MVAVGVGGAAGQQVQEALKLAAVVGDAVRAIDPRVGAHEAAGGQSQLGYLGKHARIRQCHLLGRNDLGPVGGAVHAGTDPRVAQQLSRRRGGGGELDDGLVEAIGALDVVAQVALAQRLGPATVGALVPGQQRRLGGFLQGDGLELELVASRQREARFEHGHAGGDLVRQQRRERVHCAGE